MTGLRHAATTYPPEKLSRGKQTGILLEIVIAARVVRRQMGERTEPTINAELDALRASLRLDDPVLDDLIARGAHKLPWSTPPVGTMEGIVRKYGG